MKNQVHNQGSLEEITVKIESAVVESLKQMANNSNMTIDDIVVIALKRYRASHAELLGKAPQCD
mgnify:FL=1|jgi:NRPS condensation-like uncharacterized protein